ncbi:MAG: Na+ dependent nucleoside transporter N-terminal domain-containing protein [Bacteroidales bacterium]|nr:Na+ dependent nucleoside transporter N-terminal domain-containing protein [Bacteroidales bacterium]
MKFYSLLLVFFAGSLFLTLSLMADPQDTITQAQSHQELTTADTTAQVPEEAKKQLIPEGDSGFTIISLLRGLLGMMVIIFISWVFSSNRKAISWRVVATGLALQIVLAFGVLHLPLIQNIFDFVR